MSRKLVVCVSTNFDGKNIKSVSTGVEPISRHFEVTDSSFSRMEQMANNSGNRQDTELSDGFGFTFFYNSGK
jgi:hypothetical protein